MGHRYSHGLDLDETGDFELLVKTLREDFRSVLSMP